MTGSNRTDQTLQPTLKIVIGGAVIAVVVAVIFSLGPAAIASSPPIFSYRALPHSTAVVEVEFTAVQSPILLTVELLPDGLARVTERVASNPENLLKERFVRISESELYSMVEKAVTCGLHVYDEEERLRRLSTKNRRAPRVFDGGSTRITVRFDFLADEESGIDGQYSHSFKIRDLSSTSRAFPEEAALQCADEIRRSIVTLEARSRGKTQ